MSKELLGKTIDALSTMMDYADDGTLSYEKDYDEYKDFFDSLEEANEVLEKLNELYNADSYSWIENKEQ